MQATYRRKAGVTLAALATVTTGLMVTPLASAQAAPGVPTAVATTTATAAPARSAHRQMVRSLRKQLVALALTKVGVGSYVWGGVGPDAFDCSGFAMWLYQQTTGTLLPHYSGAQMDVTTPVDPAAPLRRGDLLFYGPGGSQHVAIYAGRGMQIGANNPRSGIVLDSIDGSYWSQRYVGAGRVIQ